MAQFFGVEEIKELIKTSQTTLEWTAGSVLRIGGQGYNISSALTLNLATDIDTGSVANDTIYYVYAVVVAGIVSLKYSLSDTAPTGFTAYRKIGAFQTDGSAELIETSTKDYGSVGDIIQSMLTEEQFVKENGAGWVLADGRSVTGSKYAALIGANIPDLRGRFLRGKDYGAGTNPDGDVAVGTVHNDKTAKNGLVSGNDLNAHTHYNNPENLQEQVNVFPTIGSGVVSGAYTGGNQLRQYTTTGNNTGNHTHSLTSTDNETAPKSVIVNFFIKINDIAI